MQNASKSAVERSAVYRHAKACKSRADGKCGDHHGAWSSVICECYVVMYDRCGSKAAAKANAARGAVSDAIATIRAASDARAMSEVRTPPTHQAAWVGGWGTAYVGPTPGLPHCSHVVLLGPLPPPPTSYVLALDRRYSIVKCPLSLRAWFPYSRTPSSAITLRSALASPSLATARRSAAWGSCFYIFYRNLRSPKVSIALPHLRPSPRWPPPPLSPIFAQVSTQNLSKSGRAARCRAVARNVRLGWSGGGAAALGNTIQVRRVSINWVRLLNRFTRFGYARIPRPSPFVLHSTVPTPPGSVGCQCLRPSARRPLRAAGLVPVRSAAPTRGGPHRLSWRCWAALET